MRRGRGPGFLLVVALLFVVVLLLLGIGFLGSQAARYRAVTRAAEAAQARALALAGLEDARVKMEQDLYFPPPPSGPGQPVFSYSERLDLPGGVQGNYLVVIDSTHADPPFEVVSITATGALGPAQNPTAQHTIKAELDVAETVRGTGSANPDYFRYTHLEDQGSL